MLPTSNRLRRTKDFDALFKEGRRFRASGLTLFYKPNNLASSRFAFVVSSRVSKKAVLRNRLRRRLAEIVRRTPNEIKKGYDVIILPQPEMALKNFDEVKEAVLEVLKVSRLIKQ